MRWAGRPRQWSWRRCEANRSRNVSSCPPRWSSATRAVELHPATGRREPTLHRAEPDARVDCVKPEIEELMRRMTLLEKIGQMTQVDVNSLQEGAVREVGVGSVLSGGGVGPGLECTWRIRRWKSSMGPGIAEAFRRRRRDGLGQHAALRLD